MLIKKQKYCILYVPFPNADSAKACSEALLQFKLAACVQQFSANSVFLWKGNMESSLEEILIIKTLQELTEAAMQKIQSMHPYEIPCIASWEVQVNEDYYNWMRNELNS